MKTPSRTVFTLLALALLCLAVRASGMPISNIIKNGGFETGSLSHWMTSGNTGGSGGSSTANASNNGAFGVDQDSAHTGNFGAFAAPGGSLGFLEQDLHTVKGSSYELSFWIDGGQTDAFSAPSGQPVEFEVFWNGVLLFRTFTPPTSYTQFTFTGLLATHPSTDLRFGFRDDFGTIHLDDVVAGISRVPEAFSTIWLALPLLILPVFARHARKQIHLGPGLR